jgi:hypothetical protein
LRARQGPFVSGVRTSAQLLSHWTIWNTLFDAMPDGVAILDSRGRIVYRNVALNEIRMAAAGTALTDAIEARGRTLVRVLRDGSLPADLHGLAHEVQTETGTYVAPHIERIRISAGPLEHRTDRAHSRELSYVVPRTGADERWG